LKIGRNPTSPKPDFPSGSFFTGCKKTRHSTIPPAVLFYFPFKDSHYF
jgi:hypothetical protein